MCNEYAISLRNSGSPPAPRHLRCACQDVRIQAAERVAPAAVENRDAARRSGGCCPFERTPKSENAWRHGLDPVSRHRQKFGGKYERDSFFDALKLLHHRSSQAAKLRQ